MRYYYKSNINASAFFNFDQLPESKEKKDMRYKIRNPLIQRLDDGSEAGSDENKDENQLPNGKTDQISGLFEKFRAFCSGWKKTEANSDTPAAIFGQKMNTRKVGRSSK